MNLSIDKSVTVEYVTTTESFTSIKLENGLRIELSRELMESIVNSYTSSRDFWIERGLISA